jgi:hypothetical protein
VHAHLKLGRIRPSFAERLRAPRLAKYATRALVAPTSCRNTPGALVAMFGNDRYGDCTVAALANFRAICAAKEGLPFPTTEADVVREYLRLGRGQDRGLVERDVLRAATEGVDLGGGEPWRVAVWLSVDPADRETCRALVAEAWSLYLGVALPVAAQDQDVWDCDPQDLSGDAAPGSWGGHALLWSDFDEDGTMGLVTWGMVKKATPAWFSAYCQEAYVLVDEDRARAIGVDWDRLMQDLATVGTSWAAGEAGARVDPSPPDGRGWDDPDDQGGPGC